MKTRANFTENPVLETTKYVVNRSEDVSIDKEQINDVCNDSLREELACISVTPFFDLEELNLKDKISFSMIFNSMNFCFWGNPKWTVEIDSQKYDGATALFNVLKKSVLNKRLSLDPLDISKMSIHNLQEILSGNITIPLIEKRYEYLTEIGKNTVEKGYNNISDIILESDFDAINILNSVIATYPSYQDIAEYKGKRIHFNKRAQLAIYEISKTISSDLIGAELSNVSGLSAFADYKIPQTLRKMGILHYSKRLEHIIDKMKEIPSGSKEEVEIRANAIWAVEYMKKKLNYDSNSNESYSFTSADIDSLLWVLGQKKSPEDKPYHRTITTAY